MVRVSLILLILISGCVDVPLEVDETDVESREELSVAQVKQTLWSLYDVDVQFVPWYDHFHMYSLEEVIHWFAMADWTHEFEYDLEHRNCVYQGGLLYYYLYGGMPGIPMFLVDIYPLEASSFEGYFKGHLYVGVLIQPSESANRICLLLDPRYPPPDSRAFTELDMSTMRIGQIRMAPGR